MWAYSVPLVSSEKMIAEFQVPRGHDPTRPLSPGVCPSHVDVPSLRPPGGHCMGMCSGGLLLII